VTGDATYSKLQRKESANSDQPLQKAVVNLNDVTLSLSKVFPGIKSSLIFF
jgi:vacuolar protein sorting-associated protein 13A/C